jgi:hypothetical protein
MRNLSRAAPVNQRAMTILVRAANRLRAALKP